MDKKREKYINAEEQKILSMSKIFLLYCTELSDILLRAEIYPCTPLSANNPTMHHSELHRLMKITVVWLWTCRWWQGDLWQGDLRRGDLRLDSFLRGRVAILPSPVLVGDFNLWGASTRGNISPPTPGSSYSCKNLRVFHTLFRPLVQLRLRCWTSTPITDRIP